jgi:hypothetical protein
VQALAVAVYNHYKRINHEAMRRKHESIVQEQRKARQQTGADAEYHPDDSQDVDSIVVRTPCVCASGRVGVVPAGLGAVGAGVGLVSGVGLLPAQGDLCPVF